MKTTTDKAKQPTFQKSDVPNLYRYTSGVYYGIVRHKGKLHKKSLETTDKGTAKGKLTDWQRDLGKVDTSQGKLTLAALCERYLSTVTNQKLATVRRKKDIVARLLKDFKPGADVQVSKVKPSDVETWLAGYKFGYASHNLYLECIQAILRMAVADKAIVVSPADDVKRKKVKPALRDTPSFDEFNAIVADVRKQRFNIDAEEAADYLAFMGLVGVGQAELCGLKIKHVNLEKKQLTFYRVKTSTPYTVPIFGQAEALVTKLINKPGMKPNDNLFSIKEAKRSLIGACKRLGFTEYSPRALRRMFITRAIEKGMDVKVIAQFQGHTDGGKLILSTYSNVRNAHAETQAKLLD